VPADTEPAAIPQGSLKLLDTPVARELLASAIPARMAYTAKDGTPRIVPTWFRWTNGELVMPTYIQAPHIPAPGARRLGALRARPDVAISIDTGTEPPQVLLVRGKAQIAEVDGVDPDYAASARQYLGEDAARELLDMVDQPGTRMARITVRPAWVGLLDFAGGRLPGVMAVPET
jgi:Pyridoxamine 5'-phosphate oxidase